jgi:hypothetical protein
LLRNEHAATTGLPSAVAAWRRHSLECREVSVGDLAATLRAGVAAGRQVFVDCRSIGLLDDFGAGERRLAHGSPQATGARPSCMPPASR